MKSLRWLLRRALRRAGCLIGLFAGLAAGWFGAVAGFMLGMMVDEARMEAQARRGMRAYLADPDGFALEEPLPGLGAAAALALSWPWPDPERARASIRASFEALCDARLALERSQWRWLRTLLDAIPGAAGPALEAQARRLALDGCPATRRLLADFAYDRLASSATPFDRAGEDRLRVVLADCGLDAVTMAQSRATAFPDSQDPWSILGLEPGATAAEVRRAFLRLSRHVHPDTADSDLGAEEAANRFRALRSAYETLSPARGRQAPRGGGEPSRR